VAVKIRACTGYGKFNAYGIFGFLNNFLRTQGAEARKSQVGSGDRSERIRTYNFPQNRLTDHRINLTLYKLDLIMQGDVEELFDALKLSAREELLRATAS